MYARSMNHRINGDHGPSFDGTAIHAAEGVHEGALAIVRRYLPLGAKVADLGAGSGAFSLRLKSVGFEAVAVDMNVDARPQGIRFIEADIMDLGSVFEPESLPAAVAIESMEHLRDPIGFLQSVLSVLEPGGFFMATTPNISHPYSRLKFMTKGTFLLFTPEFYWGTGHTTPLPEWLLREHLTYAGFERIENGLIGSLGFGGIKQIAVKVMRIWLRSARAPLGIDGDGSNLVMIARKPNR